MALNIHDDLEFEDLTVASVSGASFVRSDGWSFCIPDGADVVVRPGMVARFYGKGIGFPVRGLFIDGQRVFYRTAAEQAEHHAIETYGKDAAEWLARWDAGRGVWSITMGGLGPGYEQCIQITAAEVLRHMLAAKYDPAEWHGSDEKWRRDVDAVRQFGFSDPTIEKLGLSGAQWGAAFSLARNLYERGPRATLGDERVKERLIQVSKHFPGAA
jgi:hypothetical protein